MKDITPVNFHGEIEWLSFEQLKGQVIREAGYSYTVTRAPKMTEVMAEEMAKFMLGVGPVPAWMYPEDKK